MVCEEVASTEEREIEESPSSTAKFDMVDMPSKDARVSNYDIFVLVMSIVTHIIDFMFDVNVARHYLTNEQYEYFTCTVFVILVPSLIHSAVHYRMRQQDQEELGENPPVEKNTWACTRWSKEIVTIILQVAPLRSYCESLKYALISRKCQKQEDRAGQKQYYLKMVKENQDIAFITILESFLETAPQQIVQISIILMTYRGDISGASIHQILSIVSSFISMAWSMASYNRSIRLAQDDKSNIGSVGSVLQWSWHLLIITSRIVTLVMAFLLSRVSGAFFLLFHWISMTMWISNESHGVMAFCRNRRNPPHVPATLKERINAMCFSSLLGAIYTFVYVNTDDNGTYMRHFAYYATCIVENMIVCVLWIYVRTDMTVFYCMHSLHVLPILSLIPYVLGVAIMIIYYLYFHPSKRQKIITQP